MSERYPGGIITKTPVTPSGPYQNGTAPGIWTLDQQLQFQQQGIWPTAGLVQNYIEDVFSTYLYTGTGATQSITNNIDLSTKGGMVWLKDRSQSFPNSLYDSARGVPGVLHSDDNSAATTAATQLNAFNSNGFTIGGSSNVNNSGSNLVSWTFRKQAKFFDVQTFTSNSSKGATVNHNLGVTPSFVIIKCTGATEPWWVWHTSMPSTSYYMILNGTQAQLDGGLALTLSSTQVVIPSNYLSNASTSYVMYVYASNAGGFGNAGTDNVITCGSFTTDGSGNATVTLGYEPQWVLVKRYDTTQSWYMMDVMRGMNVSGTGNALSPNTTAAEISFGNPSPTATGFQWVGGQASAPLIYIAIRRGPMKVPTDATKVYNAVARTGTGASATITGLGFTPDWWHCFRTSGGLDHPIVDRLRGSDRGLYSNLLQAEDSLGGNPTFSVTMDGVSLATLTGGLFNGSGSPYINHFFKRSPSYFDIVCYSGTGSATTQTHNLGVVPQLIIVKRRSASGAWDSYSAFLANTDYIALSSANPAQTNTDRWNSTSPTSSVFTVGTSTTTNASGSTYVAYLFATTAGVSKVGTYTGNGTTQTINCGFTGGARFVLIKRTDSSGGDWYTYDTVSGMTVLTDPYILMNSTAAQTATLGSVTTVTTGFALNSAILADINVSAGTYIFLAIA